MESLRNFVDDTLAQIPAEEQVSASTEELRAQLEQLKVSYQFLFKLFNLCLMGYKTILPYIHCTGLYPK